MQRWDVKYFLDTQVCLVESPWNPAPIKFIQQIAGLRDATGGSSSLAC